MRNKKLQFLLLFFVIILVTISLHYFGVLNFFENGIRRIINPVSTELYSVSMQINDNTVNFESIEDLQSAYKDLLTRQQDYDLINTQLGLLKNENEQLKQQLNFLQKTDYKYKSAQVIGLNVEPVGNTMLINLGRNQGIEVGQPVIAGGGYLIGKIARVEDNQSVLRLIYDNQSAIAATVLNTEKSMGVVEGGFGLSVRMNLIPQNEVISVGDSVITSGLEDQIPRGLIIGNIQATEKEPYKPFQRAILTPYPQIGNVHIVSVIIS
ncbi:MAG: rod shape-determining protein MreC [Candidatus Magasanikbacteria bacterium CG11_big_fil_rev_8_21_14_0_20_39_34]|uniref:Cell shape-determining protein MreC n=1 Tax=Candidatus Magasanikbacteria bacterium CG11_big_fil_rev_8_21_14_0_20_39_34 TaxID=1974653 RepID=A0A2H0N5G8_9BACT|nr:MAG: rod shape-determining protein MreC [Candidatus Magasanikbacteria bacterium CG11_big_fil_rev_8_21_14_0_20_39_34]